MSMVLLLVSAAYVRKVQNPLGISTLMYRDTGIFSWKRIVLASAVLLRHFLGEILSSSRLSQLSEAIFGSISVCRWGLWLPFLLHFAGVFFVGDRSAFSVVEDIYGHSAATAVHCHSKTSDFFMGGLGGWSKISG